MSLQLATTGNHLQQISKTAPTCKGAILDAAIPLYCNGFVASQKIGVGWA